ncbi:hypothetical protein FACS1894201_04320 [Bacteroidia bacterium]|nr:hypothetical protein FACS1894201_04320 [Bacteroidia bacterium]
MNNIFDLQQTDEYRWQAKYRGNYGIYTIKIAFDERGQRKDFSCTCPSDYYPCKHIGYVQDEIEQQTAKNPKIENPVHVEEILQNVSLDELRAFVVKKSQYNSDLTNAIILEFAGRIKKNGENIYIPLIRKVLDDYPFDMENFYDYEENVEFDILDDWTKKAQELIAQGNYAEAELICKACIEEYAAWLQRQDADIEDYIENYESGFFALLYDIADSGKVDLTSLYDYCKMEQSEKKYMFAEFQDEFNNLMAHLAPKVNPEDFIASQEKLLQKVSDKSSSEAQTILKRMMDFYHANNQPDKAEKLLEENVQIESFCQEVVKKRIEKEQYKEAKILINNHLNKSPNNNFYYNLSWKELLLTIAQRENDLPAVRKTAFEFIENHFDSQYFTIYKNTFTKEKWAEELEKIITHYEKSKNKMWSSFFNNNIAELLRAENLQERLLNYIEAHLSAENIEKYHKAFVENYPDKTLKLFRDAIDDYTEKNIGRDTYEYVNRLLRLMCKIGGGDKIVAEMVGNYRVIYKNRRAMMEVLGRL